MVYWENATNHLGQTAWLWVGLSGNGLSRVWKKLRTLPTKIFSTSSIRLEGVKGLIMIRSNLVVTWKFRTHMGIVSWSPLGLHWFFRGKCIIVLFLQVSFQFVPKKQQQCNWRWSHEIIMKKTTFSIFDDNWWEPVKGLDALKKCK